MLKDNKAPGPDGFTAEFYKKFQGIIIDLLYDMIQSTFESGSLPPSMMEANISLILKKGKSA